jgi:CubicO group peptidase (beta-lactamase class C family)
VVTAVALRHPTATLSVDAAPAALIPARSCPGVASILLLLFFTLSSACSISDPDIKHAFTGYAPESIGDGWVVSTPQAEGLDAAALTAVYQKLFDQDEVPTAHSMLVVRHGRLVAEAYTRDPSERDRFHHLQSATKSFSAMLLGIALDRQLLPSVQTPLYQILPEAFDDDVRKRAITLHHALSMQTGLQFVNDENTGELIHSKGSSLEFVLHRPLIFEPGSAFDYHDGNPQLISGAIQRASGLTEEDFARRYLLGPLGIDDYQWEKHGDGLTFGAFGLWLRPRDMAKVGQLLVRRGEWKGQRIISSTWLATATRPQTRTGDYGYYFWLSPDGSFRASGHGGQIIHVWPSLDLVVVITADPYSDIEKLSPGLDDLPFAVAAAVRAP